MTDFAVENGLLTQLSGVAKTQKDFPCLKPEGKSNDRFVVLNNTKSWRLPNTCVFVNGTRSRGFVHRNYISDTCRDRSVAAKENESKLYFSLLKEYVEAVLATKRLIDELECLMEQCHDDKQIGLGSIWDLSKVLNVLERYKCDAKVIRTLEKRLKLMLKLELPYLFNRIAITSQGLYKFLYCTHTSMIFNILSIIDKEMQNINSYSSEVLMNKDSEIRINMRHFSKLAGKFERLAFEIISELNQWSACWRDRVTIFVSKKGGLRSEFPFVYLGNLIQPHNYLVIEKRLQSLSLSMQLKRITHDRTLTMSDKVIMLFNESCMNGQRSSKLPALSNGFLEQKHETDKEKNRSEARLLNLTETLSKPITKRSRNQFFQDFCDVWSHEDLIMTEIIGDISSYHSEVLKVNLNKNNRLNHSHNNKSSNLHEGLQSLLVDSSTAGTKKVHWVDVNEFEKKLVSIHMEMLQKNLAFCVTRGLFFGNFYQHLSHEEQNMPLLCMEMRRMLTVISCLSVKKLKSDSGGIEPAFLKCVKTIASNSIFFAAFQRWHHDICIAQVTALNDKCRKPASPTQNYSNTMASILEALNPVQDMLQLVASIKSSHIRLADTERGDESCLSVFNCILCFSTTLQLSLNWLETKCQQFLSSGSWEQFHFISNNDASALQEKLRMIIPYFASFTKKVYCSGTEFGFFNHNLESVKMMIAKIKEFHSTIIEALFQGIKCRSATSFKEHFPPAKQWRKKGPTRLPFEANSYMKLVSHQVLVPVIESIKFAADEDVDEILFKCFTLFVSSLMNCILDQSIKFSYYGAHQLRLDFKSFKDWIAQDVLPIPLEKATHILGLAAFTDMDSAITLLCCQPEHKYRSNFGSELEVASSMASSSSQGSFTGSFFEDTIKEIELRNKDQWLALRVKGGQNKSKLLCISPS